MTEHGATLGARVYPAYFSDHAGATCAPPPAHTLLVIIRRHFHIASDRGGRLAAECPTGMMFPRPLFRYEHELHAQEVPGTCEGFSVAPWDDAGSFSRAVTLRWAASCRLASVPGSASAAGAAAGAAASSSLAATLCQG